jgi:hypothetical protein
VRDGRWEKKIREKRKKKKKKEKKKKCADYVREKRNKIGERVGKWILLIKIGEYFYLSKLFG